MHKNKRTMKTTATISEPVQKASPVAEQLFNAPLEELAAELNTNVSNILQVIFLLKPKKILDLNGQILPELRSAISEALNSHKTLQKANDTVSTVIKKNEAMSNILMGMLEHLSQVKSDLETLDDNIQATDEGERPYEEERVLALIGDIEDKLFNATEAVSEAIGTIVSVGLIQSFYYKSENK